MEQKLIARPAFNRISRKWNITIKTSEGEIKLGHINDNPKEIRVAHNLEKMLLAGCFGEI